MTKLSIITINFNNVHGLIKTIDSVLAQTSNEFEYIIVDGGSTDGSKELIEQFAIGDKRLTKWISELDNGIYHAMNKGILMAKGEYLQFLNSGDYLVAADVTEKILKEVVDSPIYYGNMLKVLSDGSILYNKKIPAISFLTFYIGTINHSPAYIYRKLFDKYGLYDESLKIVSDWKFFLIVVGLNNEEVQYIDVDVTYFDMKGISNTNLILDKLERKKVLTELIPPMILADYVNHSEDIIKMSRLKRYRFIKWITWLVDRIIFKYEKYLTKKRKEHIFFND